MKKFEFRLASILRLRDTHLAIEKNQLQQLFLKRKGIEKSLQAIGEDRTESEKEIHEMASPTSADLRALSAFLLGSKAREARLRHALQSCEEEIAEQRQRTLQAERNQKLLLNLKAKQKEGWQQELDKELEVIAQEAWQSGVRSKQQS